MDSSLDVGPRYLSPSTSPDGGIRHRRHDLARSASHYDGRRHNRDYSRYRQRLQRSSPSASPPPFIVVTALTLYMPEAVSLISDLQSTLTTTTLTLLSGYYLGKCEMTTPGVVSLSISPVITSVIIAGFIPDVATRLITALFVVVVHPFFESLFFAGWSGRYIGGWWGRFRMMTTVVVGGCLSVHLYILNTRL